MTARTFTTLLIVVSLALSAYHWATAPSLSWAFKVENPPLDSAPPRFATVFDYRSEAGSAHAPAIRLGETGFSLIWFDGTRESHEDVVIRRADFSQADGRWNASDPQVYLQKETMSAATVPRQVILSLGNTIQLGEQATADLATVVSFGGWAAASVALVETGFDGLPALARKLHLSPMLNRSHLVRAPTVPYADGTDAIPAYFELGNAFGELVRLDASGRVRDKQRISQGRLAIQPVIVPFDRQNAVALMRNFDRASDRLVASWTDDGGQSWSATELLDLPNPNAPVAALRLSDGQVLMAFNNSPADASILALALSDDRGRSWRVIETLEQGGGQARYPAIARLAGGDIVLTYSVDSKKGIRAHVFNEAWVISR